MQNHVHFPNLGEPENMPARCAPALWLLTLGNVNERTPEV